MQRTIRYATRCTGIAINGQRYTAVTFQPAPPNTGVVFVREDLPGRPEIPCGPEYARTDSRWTSLVRGDIRIEHTEHLLAAINGLGLDNIKIHLDGPYIPVVSSFSSRDFVEALLKAEPVSQDVAKKYFTVREPQCLFDSFCYEGVLYNRVLLALPSPQFTLTYLLDYPGKQLPTQLAHFVLDNDNDFASQIASARSYIMDYEYDEVIKLIGKGMDDCLVVSDGPLQLQWDNEPARHKVLDLLGDLGTLGQPVKGHFIGFRTGHKANIQMCHRLIQLKEGYAE